MKVFLSELGRFDEYQRAFDYYPIYLLVVGTFYALPVFQLLVTYRQVWVELVGVACADSCVL